MNKYNEQITEQIGLKIKFERQKRKISQEKLAEMSNLNKNSLGNIERGNSSPTIETLNRIAFALDISLPELVDINNLSL